MNESLTNETIKDLCEMFPTIHRKAINFVAEECGFNAHLTYEKLFQMDLEDPYTIIALIRQEWKVLVLMRGLPGSGKSYLASEILKQSMGSYVSKSQHIFSADDYFMQRGSYKYNVYKLKQAHNSCQTRSIEAMINGVSPVLIDNTNLSVGEMYQYFSVGVQNGYIIKIAEVKTPWALIPIKLFRRNTHGVPLKKIEDMMKRYETGLTGDILLKLYHLKYDYPMPQKRQHPPLLKNETDDYRGLQEAGPSHKNLKVSRIREPIVEFLSKRESYSDEENADVNMEMEEKPKEIEEVCEIPMGNLIEFSDDEESAPKDSDWSIPFVDEGNSRLRKKNKPATAATDMRVGCPNFESPKSPTLEGGFIKWSGEGVLHSGQPNVSQPDLIKKNNGIPEVDLSSWGTSFNILKSSKLALPIESTSTPRCEDFMSDQTIEAVEMVDKEVNTCPAHLIHENSKITVAQNRSINPNYSPMYVPPLSKKSMISCGTSTDVVEMILDDDPNVNKLKEIFPAFSTKHILDVYKTCKEDYHWTYDTLAVTEFPGLDFEDLVSQEVVPSVRSDDEVEMTESKASLIDDDNLSDEDVGMENDRKTSSSCSIQSSDNDDLLVNDGESLNFVTLDLGENLVPQLEKLYGKVNANIEPHTKIQLTEDLARQLYAIYNESVCYQQYENQKEDTAVRNAFGSSPQEELQASSPIKADPNTERDEQLAQMLLEEEHRRVKEQDLSYIQDEELAKRLQREMIEKHAIMKPEDLATILTKQKLYEAFPMIQKTSIDEILKSCQYNYEETLNILKLEDENYPRTRNLENPPLSVTDLKNMKKNREKVLKIISDSDEDDYKLPDLYREDANVYTKTINSLQLQVDTFERRNMPEVVDYYSDLMKKVDQKRTLAQMRASYLCIANFNYNNDTLDLHYLFVKEAVACLDIFVDSHISKLCKIDENIQKEKVVFVIPGRGLHSAGGVPKLKPAIMRRLKDRKIKCALLNEGLLKVFINRKTAMSTYVPYD